MSGRDREVILGVDTHLDSHVGAVVDDLGRASGTKVVPATPAGSELLLTWVRSLGTLKRAGVEGTGTYGASVARYLTAAGVQVIEVNRPNRTRRRRMGKNDPTDAENAARAVLAGDATAAPKSHNGLVEALRGVMVARRSAVKARTQAGNQLRSLVVTAPDRPPRRAAFAATWRVRHPLRGLSADRGGLASPSPQAHVANAGHALVALER